MSIRGPEYEKFAAAMRVAGHRCEVEGGKGNEYSLVVDGVAIEPHKFVIRERTTGGWRPVGTGTHNATLRLGSYNNCTNSSHQFPQRKDGSYDYARAVPLLWQAAVEADNAYVARRTREANDDIAKALRNDLRLDMLELRPMFMVSPSEDERFDVKVSIDVHFDCTAAQARHIHATLKQMGIIKEKAK